MCNSLPNGQHIVAGTPIPSSAPKIAGINGHQHTANCNGGKAVFKRFLVYKLLLKTNLSHTLYFYLFYIKRTKNKINSVLMPW